MLGYTGLLGIIVLLASMTCLVRIWLTSTYPRAAVIAYLLVLGVAQVMALALSAAEGFRPAPLLMSWGLLTALSAVAVVRLRARIVRPTFSLPGKAAALWSVVGLVLGLTFVSGLAIAPTNYDSQTYHLPRAMHWLQDGTISAIVTPNSRENLNPTLPSVMDAILLAASPSGHLVALVQWLAGLAVLVAVGLATRLLFARERLIPIAVLFAATIPMFVVMLSTTQVDLLAGVPLAGAAVAFASLGEGRDRAAVLVMSLSIGSAASIKLTSVLLMVPFVIWFGVVLIRRRGLKWGAGFALTAIGAVAALSGPFLVSLAAAGDGEAQVSSTVVNEDLLSFAAVANGVKNLSTMFQAPVTSWSSGLTELATGVLGVLGLDANDPAMTFPATPVFWIYPYWSDSTLGAPLHVLLALAGVIALLAARKRRARRTALFYAAALVAQFVLIAAVIRWQPWINRFLFLIVVAAAPLGAYFIQALPRLLRVTGLTVLAALGLTMVLIAPDRGLLGTSWLPGELLTRTTVKPVASLVGEDRLLHLGGTDLAAVLPPFREAVEYAASLDPDQLEILLGENSFEYPIWFENARLDQPMSIVHVGDQRTSTPAISRVRLCVIDCDRSDLVDVRDFPGPVGYGYPALVVGRVLD